ncbi:alpha/beta hydrolase [Xanthomonas bundabergensis]|uniref:alpha/beta hydrolase n=1 Tax=Xanthomonas bundabergensis TaxID=3160842 RepID=UPI00351792BB
MRSLFVRLATLPVLFAGMAPCHAGTLPPPGGIAVEHAVANAIDGTPLHYDIGTLSVPENRDKPDSRVIQVGFARVKASRPSNAPPTFLLAGGPGVTMLDIVLDRDDAARRRIKAWQAYAEVADLVVVEQRGYTLRGERMELDTPALPLDQPMTTAQDIAITRDLARRAQAAYPHADLSGYSIAQIADDVDDLRKALGYDRINLVAASFGSQWAFAVMKRHRGRVARAVISAAEPLDAGYDQPSQVFAAFQRIAAEADQSAALAPYLPTGGMIAAMQATRDRFANGPIRVDVEHDGRRQQVTLGLEDYQLALITYSANAATFPRFVLSAYHGHYDDWARDAIAWRAPERRALINPLINIGLDMSAPRKRLLWSDPALPMLGRWNFAAYLATKGEWASADAGDAMRAPILDPTPVLFVQGDWDTSTPLENTLALLPYFPNSRTVLLHRAQHNGTFALLRSRPELAAKVYAFLRDGDTRTLPADAALDPVAFAAPAFAAPTPGAAVPTAANGRR